MFASGVSSAIGGITALGGASVVAGSKFETSLAQLSTIADTNAVSMEEFSGELKALSSQTGQTASDLALVAYNAISAGTDTKDAMQMVKTATDLATGGFTNTDAALSVLTTTINAYGDAAGSAEEISDSLIMVQNLGVTTVDQLSSSMGKAIATGSAYGISLGNIESSYVSLTKQGISTEEATTYMASMFNELGDSGSEVGKILKEQTGQSFGELMESGFTLADVLGIINESVDGNAEAMMNLWGSAEAGKASNAIINEGLQTFNDNLNTIQGSTGATQEAVEAMQQTFEYKADQIKQTATNLGIGVFEGLQDGLSGNGGVLDLALEWLGELQTAFDENGVEGLVGTLGVVLADVVASAAEFAPSMIELALQLISALAQGILDNLPKLTEAAAGIANALLEGIGDLCPTISPITDVLQMLIDNFDTVLAVIVPLTAAFVAWRAVLGVSALIDVVSKSLNGMTLAQYAAKTAQDLLNMSMLANPITWIVMAIAALVAAFIYLWNTSDSFREFWINIWDEICKFFSNAWDEIVNFCTQTIPNLITNIGTWFSELPEKIAYWLGYAIGKVIVWAVEMPKKANEAGKNFLEKVIGFFKELPGKTWEWLLKTITQAAEFAVKMAVKARESGEEFVENITTVLKELPGQLLKLGSDIVQGLIDGIKGRVSDAVAAAKDMAASAFKGAQAAVDSHSPSRKFRWLGEMCVAGFDDPLEAYNPYETLQKSMRANVGTLRTAFAGSYVKGSYGGILKMDYKTMKQAFSESLHEMNLVVQLDNREMGRIVRGYI